MTKPLVIYHGNCPDGFTAAWVTARALGDVELYKGVYQEPPPLELAVGRDVYVVDFSYPRLQTEALNDAASKLTVLDHDKTAEAELQGLPYCVFDMQRSGAGLAWDYFHPTQPRPWIVDYVEDRDLWRFKLPDSELVSLRVRVTPHELKAWDELASQTIESLMPVAHGCQIYLDHHIRDVLRNLYSVRNIDGEGHDAVCVNCSYTGISDVLQGAIDQSAAPMAIGWHLTKEGRVFCSVRSGGGFDCSGFAKRLGGGGHAGASGFRLDIKLTRYSWVRCMVIAALATLKIRWAVLERLRLRVARSLLVPEGL